VVSERKGDSSR